MGGGPNDIIATGETHTLLEKEKAYLISIETKVAKDERRYMGEIVLKLGIRNF